MPIGSIIGGLISSGGNNAAAGTASAAGQTAFNNAIEQGKVNKGAVSPWTSVGAGAQNELAGLYGLGSLSEPDFRGYQSLVTQDRAGARKAAVDNFYTSPGYNFRLQQGTNALDRSAAARGGLLSGAQKQGVSDYGQNTGSAEYGNFISGLTGLSGSGATAANTVVGANTSAFNNGNSGQLQGSLAGAGYNAAGANAMAGGIVGAQNALNSLLSYGGSGGSFGLPGWK